MKLVSIAAFVAPILCIGFFWIGRAESAKTIEKKTDWEPWIEKTGDEKHEGNITDLAESEEELPGEINREAMIDQVQILWELWFDDEGASPRDPRRRKFLEYAEHVVDAVELYQREPTDIGGKLPGHENDHLLVAYMIAKESSLVFDVKAKGERGEVGMMQTHGIALAGYAKEKVRANPKLGILLGVRWMAAQVPKCTGDNPLDLPWDDFSWSGPLSIYMGGPRAVRSRKSKTCKHFTKAIERIQAVKMYRTRIDHRMAIN
jgi:hypothetical protein